MVTEFGPLGRDVFNRTYAREKPNGDKETWEECVDRVVAGSFGFLGSRPVNEEERSQLRARLRNFKIIAAGRHYWATGIDSESQFIDNCFMVGHYEPDDLSRHFCFTFERLMEGGGVGTNYSERFTSRLPRLAHEVDLVLICDDIHKDFKKRHTLAEEHKTLLNLDLRKAGLCDLCDDFDKWHKEDAILVEDSRKGWSKALGLVMNSSQTGKPVILNLTSIRPYGAKIRGFGGTASGPYFLALMLRSIVAIMNRSVGHKLTGMECNAIDHQIAVAVVSGNVRRSARIGVKSWKDKDILDFINSKKSAMACWTANISPEIDKEFLEFKPPAVEVMDEVSDNAHEHGEPGLWNVELAKHGRLNKPWELYHETEEVVAPNPCVTGDTPILTMGGWYSIKELAKHGKANIWNGYEWSYVDNIRRTMEKVPILEVVLRHFKDGKPEVYRVLHCTAYHRFRMANGSDKVCDQLVAEDELIQTNLPEGVKIPDGVEGLSGEFNWKVLRAPVLMADRQDVFCFTEPKRGLACFDGVITGQCGEISGQDLCCLGHVNMAAHLEFPDLLQSCRLVTRMLIRATFSKKPDEELAEQVRHNRRIGVGVTGYHNWLVMQGIKYSESHNDAKVMTTLDEMYKAIRDEARRYSYELRIPEPVKVTTVAPCGTISLLPGVAQGIHPVYALRFNRRVLYSEGEPGQAKIIEQAKADGCKIEDSVYTSGTKCVTYLCEDEIVKHASDPSVLEDAHDISMDDMFAVQAMFQEWFADNSISFTVNFDNTKVSKADLKASLMKWLPKLKGCTVMPFVHDRPQAPYERLTQAQYDKLKKAKHRKVFTSNSETECSNGACPIV